MRDVRCSRKKISLIKFYYALLFFLSIILNKMCRTRNSILKGYKALVLPLPYKYAAGNFTTQKAFSTMRTGLQKPLHPFM